MDGVAESYKGVSVLFIDDGRDPVMVLRQQQSGKEQKRIQLKEYDSVEALRGLMAQLGFQKRSKKEYEAYKTEQRRIQAEQDIDNEHRVFKKQQKLYDMKQAIAAEVARAREENLKKQQEKKVIGRD